MELNGARVLVTGGAGFVGSHLVDALVGVGALVTAIDNLQAGSMGNLVASTNHIRFVPVDVRDFQGVREVSKGQHLIFHLAANASVPNSVSDYKYDFETNVVGTFNVLRSAIESGVGRVVFASSAAVYGNPSYVPVDECHPLAPVSPYGATKMAAETMGLVYGKTYGLDFVSVRIFNTFGTRLTRFVMYDLISKLLKDPTNLEVLGDGTQVRDYCYITDAVRALLLLATSDRASGQAYNLAGGNPITIRDLVSLLLDVLELSRVRVRYTGQSWKGDIDQLVANTGKIQELGFKPETGLREGIVRMAESLWTPARQPKPSMSPQD